VQDAKAPPSSLHSNVEPASVEVNANAALVWLVGLAGALVMLVFGAVRSTVHVTWAGDASTFPAWSTARTRNVWLPSASALYVVGEVQAANAPASRLHWKVEPASVDVNANVALVWLVGLAGLDVIVVFGATVSTLTVRTADEPETFPAGSVAVAVRECKPSVNVIARDQLPAASAAAVPFDVAPSKTVTVLFGSAVPVTVTVALFVSELSGGLVSSGALGGVRSTVHVVAAGVASVLPAGSVARTWNVWLPSVSPV
jgi:hypothetical protein